MLAERWPTFGRQSGSRPRVQREGWHADCHVRQGKAAPSDVSTRHAARRSQRRSASALFDQIRNALSSSSAVGVSGGGGAPADGGNGTAMSEVELAGPTLRTDAQRPSRFEPTENPRGRAHGSRRPNGLDEQGLKGASTGWPCSVASPSGPRRRRCTAPIALRLAGSSSRRSGSGWRTANAIGAVEGGLRSYSLLDAETLVLVNHTVRLSGLTLSQGKGGPAGRALRSEAIAAPLFYQQRHSPLD